MPVIFVGAHTLLIEFLPGSLQFCFHLGALVVLGVEPRELNMCH